MCSKVGWRARYSDGQVIGQANDNPILDMRKYVIEFPDGHELAYTANLIAENMYTRCDIHRNQYLLLKAIFYHSFDESAAMKGEKGPHHHPKTTKAWNLPVEWKDRLTSWENLADLKE